MIIEKAPQMGELCGFRSKTIWEWHRNESRYEESKQSHRQRQIQISAVDELLQSMNDTDIQQAGFKVWLPSFWAHPRVKGLHNLYWTHTGQLLVQDTAIWTVMSQLAVLIWDSNEATWHWGSENFSDNVIQHKGCCGPKFSAEKC